MKIYVIIETFEGKITHLQAFDNKEQAHDAAKSMDEYWKGWNSDNKIPLRNYEVRAFEEVVVDV